MTDISMPPVFDGHNDTLLHLYFPERGNGRSFFIESEKGHLDLPRARKGGFGGGFFAIFPPAPTQERTMKDSIEITSTGYRVREFPALDPAYAQRITIAVAASLFRLEVESQGQFKVVRTADELAHRLEPPQRLRLWRPLQISPCARYRPRLDGGGEGVSARLQPAGHYARSFPFK